MPPSGYSETLLDHFRSPRNVGEVAEPDAAAQVESAIHGDTLRLTFALDGDRVSEVKFLCYGCTVAIASGSVATTLLEGRTVREALELTDEDIVQALGGVPAERQRCSIVVRETVHRALAGLGSRAGAGTASE